MNDQNRDPAPINMENALTGLGYQLRKGLDRVGFEADKRMRVNRVRVEVGRLQKRASQLMSAIGDRVLELEAEGAEMEPTIMVLVGEVRALRKQLADKTAEIEAVNNEQWVEPPPPVAPPATSSQQAALPAARPQVIEGSSREVGQTGNKLANCPNCNAPLRPTSAFCSNCGFKL